MSRLTSSQPAAENAAERSPENDLLDNIASLLEAGDAKKALETLGKAKLTSPAIANARAVCQLRLGDAKSAIEILRPQVISTGVFMRPDVPKTVAVNFATALLMDGNLSGGLRVLDELRDETDPGVQQLRGAIQRWRNGLSFWQRLQISMGGEPSQPIGLDFVPGRL